MATGILYYRTEGTLVTAISSLPAGQKLIYDAPDDLLEALTEFYENRINPQQSVNSAGVRRIFLRDDGLKARRFLIRGVMTKTSTDIPKIKAFRVLPQTTATLIHGIFGLKLDNADFYDQDPTATSGLMIGKVTIGYVGERFNRYAFEIELYFGGTHE